MNWYKVKLPIHLLALVATKTSLNFPLSKGTVLHIYIYIYAPIRYYIKPVTGMVLNKIIRDATPLTWSSFLIIITFQAKSILSSISRRLGKAARKEK